MKRILITLISLSIFSSCAWFTSKPIPEAEGPMPKSESEMAAELESEAENHVSNGITYHQDGNDSLAIIHQILPRKSVLTQISKCGVSLSPGTSGSKLEARQDTGGLLLRTVL